MRIVGRIKRWLKVQRIYIVTNPRNKETLPKEIFRLMCTLIQRSLWVTRYLPFIKCDLHSNCNLQWNIKFWVRMNMIHNFFFQGRVITLIFSHMIWSPPFYALSNVEWQCRTQVSITNDSWSQPIETNCIDQNRIGENVILKFHHVVTVTFLIIWYWKTFFFGSLWM